MPNPGETTYKIIAEFFEGYFTITIPGPQVFFTGQISEKENENRSLQLALDILRYHIWHNKLEKRHR